MDHTGKYRSFSRAVRFSCCAAAFVVLFAVRIGSADAAAMSFHPLGDLPGGGFSSTAYAFSADGSVAVGDSGSASGTEAYRWTSGGGMVGLGDLPGGDFSSTAFGVSADGSVVVGSGNSASGGEAFRWTSGGGMVGLGDLPGGVFSRAATGSRQMAPSSWERVDQPQARRHSAGPAAAGWSASVTCQGEAFSSRASELSADGSVVVGYSRPASGSSRPFAGRVAAAWSDWATCRGKLFQPTRASVSADGSVVIGQGNSASGIEAFRWTSDGGMVGLGDLPGGGFNSAALGISADGSVVVGTATSALGFEAYRWTSVHGMQNLRDLLIAGGVDLTGWTLTEARESQWMG